MPSYSIGQKESIIKKLLRPNAPSALALSQQIGISQGTLSRWLREHKSNKDIPMPKRPLDWTPEERFQAVMEAANLSEEEIGVYVRKKGITPLQLNEWKCDCIQAMGERAGRKPDSEKRDLKKQVKNLEKDLRRKDKALAETAALLILKKKAQDLWGDSEDS
jgi:transposase